AERELMILSITFPAMKALKVLCAITVLASGCSMGDGTSVTVQVLDDAFAPSTITIAPGIRVNWGWNGTHPHNVVFAPNSGVVSSATQITGGFDITFMTPGTYNYECTVHPGMNGTVVVR